MNTDTDRRWLTKLLAAVRARLGLAPVPRARRPTLTLLYVRARAEERLAAEWANPPGWVPLDPGTFAGRAGAAPRHGAARPAGRDLRGSRPWAPTVLL